MFTNEFQVQTDNDTTATNLKNTIDGHADFTASVSDAVVTVTRAAIGNENLTNVSSDTTRLTTTNFYGGTPLTGSDTDYVTFTQFGQYVIASNGVDEPQYYLMGTSTNFATLQSIATAGTVPAKFRVSGVIRDFLVTGNIENAKNKIAWSGINDISVWEAGVSSSDTQVLPGSGGQVVAITSGEVGYVFRQNQITRMDFVGGNVVFRFSVISPNRGAVFGQSVCQDNRQVFFYADDGFFQINGDQILPIGAEKINRFFDQDLNKAYSDRITAAVDPFNTLALWLYPSKNNPNTTGICDRLLIYNYVTQKWSIAKVKASQGNKSKMVGDGKYEKTGAVVGGVAGGIAGGIAGGRAYGGAGGRASGSGRGSPKFMFKCGTAFGLSSLVPSTGRSSYIWTGSIFEQQIGNSSLMQ